LAAAASAPAAPAEADRAPWPPPRDVRVSTSELAFERRDYDVNSTESVYVLTRFNDGWVLMLSLFEFRNPLFKKWGIYVLVSSPAGTEHWYKYDIPDRDVRVDADRLWVSDGVNTIEGGLTWYRVEIDIPGFTCELSISNLLPPWKVGDGRQELGRDGRAFAQRVLGSPWGVVTGRISLDGRPMVVRGQGLLEKSTIVMPLGRLDPLIYSARVFSQESTSPEDRWYVGMLDTTSHRAYGSVRSPRLEVARGGDWLFTTPDYTLVAHDYRSLGQAPYPAPQRLEITAVSQGYTLKATYRALYLYNVTDVMDEIPAWARPIVQLFVKRPVFQRFLGVLEGTLTYPDGRIEYLSLAGPYEFVVTR
jgi:hypothetical protein